MSDKTIRLRKGKEESLERFHPWVFSGAIESMPEDIDEGDIVNVVSHSGALLGKGHYQIGSIAVRMLTSDNTPVDEAFYTSRLEHAWSLRRNLGLINGKESAFRLVHGEGDFLPGLVIDIYGKTAVMQAHSPGMHFARNIIAKALTAIENGRIKNVYYKSETTLPYKASLDPQNQYIIGGFDTDVAEENGLKFRVDWLKGQKTGFFVDQRDNRSMLLYTSLMTQLMRIEPGKDVEEAHMRNRKLISEWVLEQGAANNVVSLENKNGKTYVRVNDYPALRNLFGQLLAEIQRIKSEGDYETGAALVEKYGVKVDPALHREVLDRYANLSIAPYKGFVNPVYTPVTDNNGNITDITVSYSEDYLPQMFRYSENYGTLGK